MDNKVISLLALSLLSTADLAAKDSKRPNIVLIMCDDLIDYGGIYGGHPLSKTPNMDRITKAGVKFTNAHSVAPLSGPSRAALFTGVYPHVSQNYQFIKWYTTPVLAHCKTYMGQLKEEGYQVYGTGKLMHDNLLTEYNEYGYGYSQGPWAYDGEQRALHPSVPIEYSKVGGMLDGVFVSLADVPTVNGYTGWWNETEKVPFRYVSDEDRDLMGDEKIANWAVAKLEEISQQSDGEPFYLGVGFSKPHTALIAPQKYFDMYPLESIVLPEWVENDKDDTYFEEVASKTAGYKHFKGMQAAYGDDIREGFRKYLQAYLACVSFADDQVGKVLDAIDKSPEADNTIVIFTSDHGYDFGQKDYFFKNSLWSTSTQVPFAVRMPNGMNANTECDYPIALTDIYPTVLDYAQIKGDNRKDKKGAKLSGHSIRTFIENPDAKKWGGSSVALSVVCSGGDPLLPQGQNYAVKGERYRYIHYVSGKEELYDCKRDPFEVVNLAADPQYAKVKADMRSEMKRLVPQLDDSIPKRTDMASLFNGDFEVGGIGWDGRAKATGEPQYVKSGMYAMALSKDYPVSQSINVKAGDSYRVSFDGCMKLIGSDKCVVSIVGSRGEISDITITGDKYASYSENFTVPSGESKITIRMAIETDDINNSAFVDNVELKILN